MNMIPFFVNASITSKELGLTVSLVIFVILTVLLAGFVTLLFLYKPLREALFRERPPKAKKEKPKKQPAKKQAPKQNGDPLAYSDSVPTVPLDSIASNDDDGDEDIMRRTKEALRAMNIRDDAKKKKKDPSEERVPTVRVGAVSGDGKKTAKNTSRTAPVSKTKPKK